jgi:chromosome partitioning protein
MGTIITVSSFKGGSGKSSTTALLAVNAAAKGLKVAVIDADPNASISTWHRTAYGGEPPLSVTECIDQDQIVTHALEVAEYHDLVLVDTAGFRNQTAVFAMGAAVLVLIPVLPDRHSVMEAAKTAKQAETVSQIARRTIPCRIVLNRWKPRGLAEQATLADIEAFKLERLPTAIGAYTALEKYTYSGDIPTKGPMGIAALGVLEDLQRLGAVSAWPRSKPSR